MTNLDNLSNLLFISSGFGYSCFPMVYVMLSLKSLLEWF